MQKIAAILIPMLLYPALADAQTDCNQLAKDTIRKSFSSQTSDYRKLLFLSTLTQISTKEAGEALAHSGKVKVGPIEIGPGTWNKDKQEKLREELQKYLNVELVLQNAESVEITSGDSNSSKSISDCIASNGGFYVSLNDSGKDTAVAQLVYFSYPGGKKSIEVRDVTVRHGKLVAGFNPKRRVTLQERVPLQVTIDRPNPKEDITVIVNTDAGGKSAYLPPAVLPPPLPPKKIRVAIEAADPPARITSGGGGRGPFCQLRAVQSCVRPQHGGKIVAGSGNAKILYQGGRSGVRSPREVPEEYCVEFWANTGACETEVSITGKAAAMEEYEEQL
ncbi:hypothetical protein [Bradyrhizobium sp. 170]|uniref:hypothetical protein n=1 Tax=Bradyrhizobium sp. 170 TaxID=2782641 RepID=UPI001FFE3571|nr:hypothetical protein [Bradyrhizobium sp. 170]UPK02835.1 hypothetical protein IVB05_35595 [Bradyrhizobium sp. 170]